MQEVLRLIQARVTSDQLCVPLSAIHYLESHRHADPNRRRRLGECMIAISAGYTIATWEAILTHEISRVLHSIDQRVSIIPLDYVGRGMRHAFGKDLPPFVLPEAFREAIPRHTQQLYEAQVEAALEKAALTGVSEFQEMPAPTLPHSNHNVEFRNKLDELTKRLEELPKNKREDFLYAASFLDVVSVIESVLLGQGFPVLDLGRIDMAYVRGFVDALPSRRADLHVTKQSTKNAQLKAKLSDLDDFASISPAVAYCDVVVCEKHFADLLRRDGFKTRAIVLTNLEDVADALEVVAR